MPLCGYDEEATTLVVSSIFPSATTRTSFHYRISLLSSIMNCSNLSLANGVFHTQGSYQQDFAVSGWSTTCPNNFDGVGRSVAEGGQNARPKLRGSARKLSELQARTSGIQTKNGQNYVNPKMTALVNFFWF